MCVLLSGGGKRQREGGGSVKEKSEYISDGWRERERG